jgi:hypothetical protein
VCDESLFNLVADREPRIQRPEGILEDDLHSTTKVAQLLGATICKPSAVKRDLAGSSLLKSKDHSAERRLTRSRLANDCERFTAGNAEVNAINCFYRLPFLKERDRTSDREMLL